MLQSINYGPIVHFQDSSLVVERYKSGFSQPTDIPFEDLSNSDTTSSVNGSMHSISGVPGTPGLPGSAEKKTILGTITGGRVKKRSGLLGLFSNNKVRAARSRLRIFDGFCQ